MKSDVGQSFFLLPNKMIFFSLVFSDTDHSQSFPLSSVMEVKATTTVVRKRYSEMRSSFSPPSSTILILTVVLVYTHGTGMYGAAGLEMASNLNTSGWFGYGGV